MLQASPEFGNNGCWAGTYEIRPFTHLQVEQAAAAHRALAYIRACKENARPSSRAKTLAISG